MPAGGRRNLLAVRHECDRGGAGSGRRTELYAVSREVGGVNSGASQIV